jgi:hypothetical protein
MQFQVYNETCKAAWDEFVRQSKNGTFLFYRDYMDYHRDRFADHSLLVRDDQRRLLALLPANRQDGQLVSHGGLTYGGFVTGAAMKLPLLLEIFEATRNYLRENSFTGLVYKTIPYIYAKMPAEEDRYALFVSEARLIRRGALAVLGQAWRPEFQERRRRGAKKALAAGLRAEASADWPGYWRLLSETLAGTHQARPVHRLEEIQNLHEKFPENIKLFGCLRQNELLGGVVIYETELVARTQYIAASERGKELGALDFLFDWLLNGAYRSKAFFDFGTSDEDQGRRLNLGLLDQKEGFGARTVVQDHYVLNVSGNTCPGES